MTRRKTLRVENLPHQRAKPATENSSALEKELLTKEEWLRLAAEGCELGLWCWNETTQSLFWDVKTREIFGADLDREVTLETFYGSVHPADVARVRKLWRYQLESRVPCDLEYRVQRPDGPVRRIHARGTGYYNDLGKPLYMVGVVFDVTEYKRAEQERLELSGRLIHAQEQERRHLAMELYDDISQRLVVVTAKLDIVTEKINEKRISAEIVQSIAVLQE